MEGNQNSINRIGKRDREREWERATERERWRENIEKIIHLFLV